MNRAGRRLFIRRGTALLIVAGLLALASCGRGRDLSSAVRVPTAPRIDPDYAGIVMPPNIAPLNFRVLEEGRDCVVRISSDAAEPLELKCVDRQCRISIGAWRQLLGKNKGKSLYYDVYVRKAGGAWTQYARFTNRVAEEPIETHIVYRRVTPNNHFTGIKGIYQRDLESFATRPILTSRELSNNCFNCHTFCNGNPNRFYFQLRGDNGGMVFVIDGRVRKINTLQPPLKRPLGYGAWHPDGVHIVSSANDDNRLYFPSASQRVDFEAAHYQGDLVIYNVETNTLSTSPQVFQNGYTQTHPSWSADGKSVFYIRCRSMQAPATYKDFDKFRFDLMRISYDVASDTWGTPEMLMECSKEGKSCTFPRASPDGKYVLCGLCNRTSFAVYQDQSELRLFDLGSKTWRRLDVLGSDFVESYPSWSSNGRWIVFAARRSSDRTELPCFAYFDAQGCVHKAFVLPQEDPGYYDTFTDSYNIVRLVNGEVPIDEFTLVQALKQPAIAALFPNPPRAVAQSATATVAH